MRGFSLPEILVVLGLLAILTGATLPWVITSYLHSRDHDSANTIVAALIRARGESLATVCGGRTCSNAAAHGVHIDTTVLVVFEGETYTDRDRTQDEPLSFMGTIPKPVDMVFEAGSARVLVPVTVTMLSANGSARSIGVNAEGAISLK